MKKSIHEVTLQGLPLLTPYLNDGNWEVRQCVAEGLGQFPERAEELLPLLRAAAQRESDPEVGASLAASIRRLEGAAK